MNGTGEGVVMAASHAGGIKTLRAQGVSKRKIANRLDISRTSVRRLLA
jgi:DNA-binding transcriptional regulator LsrR (DeoR family)